MSNYLPDFAGIFCLVIFLISITTIGDGLLRHGVSSQYIKVGNDMLEQQSLIDSDIFPIPLSARPRPRTNNFLKSS